MKSITRLWGTRVLIAGGIAIGAILWVAESGEAHGGDPSVIHGCVPKSTGLVRIVAANESCRETETALHFGSQAPQALGATLSAALSAVSQSCTPGGPTAPKTDQHDGTVFPSSLNPARTCRSTVAWMRPRWESRSSTVTTVSLTSLFK